MTKTISTKARMISLLLALALVVGMLPLISVPVSAYSSWVFAWKDTNNNGKIDSGEQTFTDWNEALRSGGTVKLQKPSDYTEENLVFVDLFKTDVGKERYVDLKDITVTLDLNGQFVECGSLSVDSAFVLSGSTKLTITDSAGGGKMRMYDMKVPFSLSDSAEVVFAGGYFDNDTLKTSSLSGDAKFTITGGTFADNPSSYVALNHYVRVDNGEGGKIIYKVSSVTMAETEAWIDANGNGVLDSNERRFASLADALDFGGEIKLYRDIQISMSSMPHTIAFLSASVQVFQGYPISKTVVLDLNGHSITADSTMHQVFRLIEPASLTLRDSKGTGVIDCRQAASQIAILYDSSSLAIEGGTYYKPESTSDSPFGRQFDRVSITGGRFNFNPNAPEDVDFNGTQKYKTYGYMAVPDGDMWKIVPDGEVCTVKVEGTYVYDGHSVIPTVTVTAPGGAVLEENVDYTVAHENNNTVSNAAKVIVTFIKDYRGSQTVTYTIDNLTVSASPVGSVKIPATGETTKVTLNAGLYVADTDVTTDTVWSLKGTLSGVSLNGNVVTVDSTANVGTVTVAAKYAGVTKTCVITLAAEQLPGISLSYQKIQYNGQSQKPVVTVEGCTENVDYTVSYFRNGVETDNVTDVGTVHVRATGLGQYQGSYLERYYQITGVHMSDVKVILSPNATYTGTPQKPTITATYNSMTLVEGKDYTVVYTCGGTETADFTNAGTVLLELVGMGNYYSSKSSQSGNNLSYTIDAYPVSESEMTFSQTAHTWDGNPHKPTVTITGVGGATLAEGKDYTVVYTRDGSETVDFTSCGTVVMAVTFMGNYTGSFSKSFTVNHSLDESKVCRGCKMSFHYVTYSWNAATSTRTSETKNAALKTTVTDVTSSGPTTWTNGWYAVWGNVQLNTVTVDGDDVHLILRDGASLSAKRIVVSSGNSLAIYGQEKGTGVLSVTGEHGTGASIGGNKSAASGAVTIHGGKITVGYGNAGTGIGSGNYGSGGEVTIYHGTVNAAGIGGGYMSSNAKVTIYGGTITAWNGNAAAAIGGYTGFSVAIHGGTITATGGTRSAGIGGSDGCQSGTVVITGGNIKATAGGGGSGYNVKQQAVGNGALWRGSGSPVTVSDGTGRTPVLETLTVNRLTESKAITALSDSGYGVWDMATMDTNKLYLYRASNAAEITSLDVEGITYECHKNKLFFRTHAYGGSCDEVCSQCGAVRHVEGQHHYNEVTGLCDECGSGEPATWNAAGNYYEIAKPGHLVWFADLVNGTLSGTAKNAAANAVLLNDIDMTGATEFVPMGQTGLYYKSTGSDKGYTGTFDGCGHVIRNLSVAGSDTWETTYGVFGTLGGTVKRLGVENFTFTVNSQDCRAGGLVGQIVAGGVVENCYVANSTVTATGKVAGGLAGCNYDGTVKNSFTYKVTVDASRTGGIVGDNRGDNNANDRKGTVSNCYTDNTAVVSSYSGNVSNCAAAVTNEVFASGEITYKLNEQKFSATAVWHQTLAGTDAQAYPQFIGGAVFCREGVYGNATPVIITGVTAQDADYNGLAHTGYTGTPANENGYTGDYEVSYAGRNSTVYSSNEAPVNAGDYTVTIATDSTKEQYMGSVSLDFTVAKRVLSVTAAEQRIAAGDDLSTDKVTLGAPLTGHTAQVTAVTKGTSCTYTATVLITDANGIDVTANYAFTATGTYHELAWDTSTHEYKCGTCNTVDSTDTTLPTAEYQIGTNGWKRFLNTISLGLFRKNYQTVTIQAADTGSGVHSVEYYVANEELNPTHLLALTWGSYTGTPISLSARDVYYVYVRVTDKAGNSAVYNSEGIVIFEDSTATAAIEYTRTTGTDVKATIAFNGNAVRQVKYGDVTLVQDTDYTVNSDGITFAAAFLETLAAQDTAHAVTVNYKTADESWNESTSYGEKAADTVISITVKLANGSVTDISNIGKEYDGDAVDAPTYTSLSTGVATFEYKVSGADDNTYSTTAPSAVGNYTVRVTVAADANYKQASSEKSFTVTPADLTAVSVVQSGTLAYTGSAQIATVTTNATAKGGQRVNFTYSTTQSGDYTAAVPSFTEATTYTVYYKAEAANHNPASGQFTVTIGKANNAWIPAAPSITGWTYGQTPSVPTAAAKFGTVEVTYTGIANDGTGYNSTQAPTRAGTYEAVFTVSSTSNWGELTATVPFTVAKAPLTVKGVDASKTYGDDDPIGGFTWNITAGALVGSDTLSGILVSRADGENVGTYPITVTEVANANPNYDITCQDGTFTINKALLIVTADDVVTVVYGDVPPTYTVQYSGFKGTDNESDLNGTLAFDCNYRQFADKGTYTVTPKGLAATNYSFRYVDGTVTVSPKPITVTVNPQTGAYGDSLVPLTATDDGIVNGDTNVYRLSTTVSTTSPVGTYDITGTALDSNYAITFANEADAYTVTARELTVTVVVADKPYDGLNTASIVSAQLNNVANGDAVELINGVPTFATVNAGNGVAVQFTAFVLDGEASVLSNYTLKQPTGVTANITNGWHPVQGTEYRLGVPKNENGWLNRSLILVAQDNYELSLTNTADGGWHNAYTHIEEGENKTFSFYVRNKTTGAISELVTETFHMDLNTEETATTGTVEFVGRNSWQEFVNNITFGLFFKDEVTVKAQAADALSGVDTIEYAASDRALNSVEVQELTDWTAMPSEGVAVTVEDTKKFVYYIRVTDKAGNVTYFSTDGAEYDTTLPAIIGMNSGAVYHTTRVVTVTDRNLQSVTLNGEPVTLVDGKLTLAGNTNATYTVKATDKAGNVTEYTVTMQTITGLTDPIKNITDGNVTGNDKQGIEQVIAAVDAELGNTDLTGDERQELVNAKEEAKKLLAKIDEVAGKKDDLTDQVTGWDKDAVTSDDKQDIQDLIDKLDELLGGDNLTEGEKEELGQTKEKAEDLIGRIDEVANEKDNLTDQVTDWDKDAVTSDDKQDIQDLIDKLDELLDGNNLTEDEKEELGQTKKEAAELIGRIEEAEESAGTENIDRTNDITADTVTTGDKADLEAAKDDLENALAGYGNNLTDDEKQEIQDSIDRIEKALKVISRVETVKDLIGNLPEVLTEDNADTVREALRAYNALTAYEQSLLGANLKAKLMSAKWAVEGAGEPADTPKNDTPTTDKPADEGGDIGAEENTKTGVTSALPAALAVAVAVSAATLWLTGKRRKA